MRHNKKGLKPPNLKEIVAPVQSRLRVQGLHASGRQIQKVADVDKYKNRRRKPGVTVASEKKTPERTIDFAPTFLTRLQAFSECKIREIWGKELIRGRTLASLDIPDAR
jgi:hypothetical protein